jgi:two-component system sensor histidine kinase CpxA
MPLFNVGTRLLIGFWVTILVALLCVWAIVRVSASDLDIAKVENSDIERLARAKTRIVRAFDQNQPIARIIRNSARNRRFSYVLYDNETKIVFARRSPFEKRLERDIQRLSGQVTPLQLTRQVYRLVGPHPINQNGKSYLLFLLEMVPNAQKPFPMVLTLLVVLFGLSLVYSFVFSKSVLRPISALRKAATELANGQWHARVETEHFGKDELGNLANTFNAMAQRIENNWHAQQRLLADVSHELRSPLARLNMAVALAEANTSPSNEAKLSFQRIEKETAKMDALIADVLALSRTEAGMAKKEKIALDKLFEEVVNNAMFEASQKGITFHVNDIPQVTIHCQIDAMQSALENVIRNAIRYTQSYVRVSFSLQPAHWVAEVHDNGGGLSHQECENVFKPFYRSDNARNAQTGGIGLGLAITQAAIHHHKGEVHAKKSDDGGLCIVIRVPVRA